MKTTLLTAVLTTVLAAGTATASPVGIGVEQKRVFEAQITFLGAADAQFSQAFPADGRWVQITNPLSISKISSLGGATCTFYGVDGSVTTVVGAQTVDVGPPQTQVGGACRAF